MAIVNGFVVVVVVVVALVVNEDRIGWFALALPVECRRENEVPVEFRREHRIGMELLLA